MKNKKILFFLLIILPLITNVIISSKNNPNIIKEKYDVVVSIDTYKAKVAEEALKAGADMVNDIWGLKYDREMASIIKEYDVPVCIMHNRDKKEYKNFFEEVVSDLKESIQIAKEVGIDENKIILDPGVGFGKNYEQNFIHINI